MHRIATGAHDDSLRTHTRQNRTVDVNLGGNQDELYLAIRDESIIMHIDHPYASIP